MSEETLLDRTGLANREFLQLEKRLRKESDRVLMGLVELLYERKFSFAESCDDAEEAKKIEEIVRVEHGFPEHELADFLDFVNYGVAADLVPESQYAETLKAGEEIRQANPSFPDATIEELRASFERIKVKGETRVGDLILLTRILEDDGFVTRFDVADCPSKLVRPTAAGRKRAAFLKAHFLKKALLVARGHQKEVLVPLVTSVLTTLATLIVLRLLGIIGLRE